MSEGRNTEDLQDITHLAIKIINMNLIMTQLS